MTELRHKSNRHIVKRIIVRGILVLDTPTSLGSGDADSPTDLPLLRDSISNHSLLTGSSIAGALRNYLRECNKGYGESDRRYDLAAKLFGDLFAYKNEQSESEQKKIELREKDTQSLLIIDDSISTKSIKAELRDGVKIDSVTRTAADKAKYDLELLQAGTKFPLSFELLIEKEKENDEARLIQALAIALSGLQNQEICLGMKKRRGFGRCHVKEWQVWNFNLEDAGDRTAWLLFDRECSNKLPVITDKIADALGVVLDDREDKRDRFLLHATFQLVGSLLIRSGQDLTGRAPDVVHLKSHRNNELKPVLSGTSLAGVLRHRAERIVNTLGGSSTLVNELFGFVEGKEAKSSRLVVHEKVIKDATDLVQNRIAIDRFTGGAYHGALFDEQPIFGCDETRVCIELELRNPEKYEIGLLLLLLKDLWTSDLPVGGESSIGRGRLKGIQADLIWNCPQNPQQWEISEENGKLNIIDKADQRRSEESVRDELEVFVKALLAYLRKEVEG
ncbi:RAMP superfamily CRISPR-associated protein [Microcoleus sp. herbarium19]|uniref:RAMP superfamily CRISPR-associated protein n=1 Tax=unclassified Microcoleus TaxID=2642155 RepID=UPI002FD4D387